MIKILVNEEWVEGEPSAGQHYRIYDNNGGFLLKQEPLKPNKIVVTSHNKRALVGVGESLTVTVEFRNSEDELLPITDSFAMPVGRVGGLNYRTLLMEFVDGVCTKTVNWNDTGEFEITERMINTHLEEELAFDGFTISVVE